MEIQSTSQKGESDMTSRLPMSKLAKGLTSLGWEVGKTYYSHDEWRKLRKALNLKGSHREWRHTAAGLISRLEALGVVERTETFRFKVVDLQPLVEALDQLPLEAGARQRQINSSANMHRIVAQSLPEGYRIFVRKDVAIELLIDGVLNFDQTHNSSKEGWVQIPGEVLPQVGVRQVYVRKIDALQLINNGHLKFSQVRDD